MKVTMKIQKDSSGQVIERHSGIVDEKKNEVRFVINGKKILLTKEEYKILEELQKDMII